MPSDIYFSWSLYEAKKLAANLQFDWFCECPISYFQRTSGLATLYFITHWIYALSLPSYTDRMSENAEELSVW